MNTSRKPVHPGLVFKEDVLVPLGMSVTVSPDMAVRISRATNTSPESWLAMQTKLDLWKSELRGNA